MGDIVRMVRHGRFIGWYVRYKDSDGKRKQRASHQPTKELARRYLLEIEARVARGLLGIPEPAMPAPTLAEVCERFLSEYRRPRIKDIERYRITARSALKRVIPFIGGVPIDGVTPRHIQRVRDDLVAGFAANTARVTLGHLGAMFGWAVKLGLLFQSPMRQVEMPGRADLVEYLSREETTALLAVAERRAANSLEEQVLHVCTRFALHSGLRKGELFGLRWCDLDLDSGRLTVARSFGVLPKGGKPRHLRIPDVLLPLLKKWRTACPPTKESLVFPVRGRSGWSMAKGSREMMRLPELLIEAGCRSIQRPWHALRHTFASHFVMSGGNILTLQKILGHSDIKMTLVYAHLAPEFLGEEMNRIRF